MAGPGHARSWMLALLATGMIGLVGTAGGLSCGPGMDTFAPVSCTLSSAPFVAGVGSLHGGTAGVAGGTGVVEFDSGQSLAIDTQGRVVVAGQSRNVSGGREIALWRYLPSGVLDTSFGTGGIVHSGPNGASGTAGAGEMESARAVLLDSQGRIVVVGGSRNASLGFELAMWRYNSSGLLD